MEGYSVSITNSTIELSVKERIKVKDFTNAKQLDVLTQTSPIVIEVAGMVELQVHNEKAKDKDYKKYVILDTAGNKYVTGSESFATSFKDISAEMIAAGETVFEIECYRAPSKNYQGKEFLTCSIV